MKRFALVVLAVLLIQPVAAAVPVEEELKQLNQQLIDALASGDREVVDRIYAPTFVRTSIDGRLLTKADVMRAIGKQKSGVTTTYTSHDIEAFVYGDTAVLAYLSIRDIDDHGAHSYFRYRVTDTFARIAGRWQKVASAGTPVIEAAK